VPSSVASCLHDLSSASRAVLIDRDPNFCISHAGDGTAIRAPARSSRRGAHASATGACEAWVVIPVMMLTASTLHGHGVPAP
jgi:hypothetical protein